MIPKIIHMTWFGDDPFPPVVIRCMESWKKHLPDYKIQIWTKDNYDLNINQWVREAYAAKKYAFVSDFARFDVLYKYGGIYLDSDVEIIKTLDPYLHNEAFAGFMSIPNIIEAEVIGSEKGNETMNIMKRYYEGRQFINPNGDMQIQPLPEIFFNTISNEHPIKNYDEQDVLNLHLYPSGVFVYHMDIMNINSAYDTMVSYHYGAGLGWRQKTGISGMIFRLYLENGLKIVHSTKKIHLFKIHRKLLLKVLKRE